MGRMIAYVFASISATPSSVSSNDPMQGAGSLLPDALVEAYLHCPIQAANWYSLPDFIPAILRLQRLLT